MSDSQIEVLLGGRPYITSNKKYGENQSLTWAQSQMLMLPRIIESASYPQNIHYSKVSGFVDELAFARGLISEASAFIYLWPKSQSQLNGAFREWRNAKPSVASVLVLSAVPELLATANILNLSGPDDRATKNDVYQRWWGLQTISIGKDVRTEYENAGHLLPQTTPFAGYGWGQQFYPSVTQSMLAKESELLNVQTIDGQKKGRITQVYGVDGKKVMQYFQCPYEVDVKWADGSSERLSYFAVRQLDPILGKPLICRAQLVMSPYDADGVPKTGARAKNAFVQQLAAVLAIAALDAGHYVTMLPAQIVRAWANISHDYLVPAGVNKRYRKMTYPQGNDTLVGWQTDSGQQIMEDIFLAMSVSVFQIARLGPKVAEFLDDYEVLEVGTVHDSGLVVCPNCHNCEGLDRADCVDFGIQTYDTIDLFSSIKWETTSLTKGDGVRCVATVKCAECKTLYYRKFETLVRRFDSILAIGKVTAKQSLDFVINNSLASGDVDGGCATAAITAYSFLPRSETGKRRIESLPRLRLFGEFQKRIKGAEVALEVGTQSRNLTLKSFCYGTYPVAGGTYTSHPYYDRFIGQGGIRGKNQFKVNADDWVTDPLTGARLCKWCEEVGRHLNEQVPTTLKAGTYYEGTSDFMRIESESGSTKFNKGITHQQDKEGQEGDYITKTTQQGGKEIDYYQLRLVKGGKVRILKVTPEQVGEPIPQLNDTPSMKVFLDQEPPCPNEFQYFLGPTFAFFDKYLAAKQQHQGQKSRFMVCEQLAYSARKNPTTHLWEAVELPASLKDDMHGGHLSLSGYRGIDATDLVWKEGNPKCVTPDGERERFPDPRLGKDTVATLTTPYADNQSQEYVPQYHILKRIGWETITTVNPVTNATTVIKKPQLFCPECQKSYHGAPSDKTAQMWKVPGSVGDEYQKPSETERRNDKKGGYAESSAWHWTLPLYTQNTPYETWVQSIAASDPEKLRQIFPEKMVKWIQAGQTFTAHDLTLDSAYPPECLIVTSDDKSSSGLDDWYIGLLPSNLSTIDSSKATIINFDGNYSTPMLMENGQKTTSVQEYVKQHSPFHPPAFAIGYEVRIVKEGD